MLTQYQTRTQRLLQNPAATNPLYATADLTDFINEARGQVAGEAECIRIQGTLPTVSGTQSYAFSAINVSAFAGVAGVINARFISRSSFGLLNAWPWEYFARFYIAVAPNAAPTDWAQEGQGASGTIFLSPKPDAIYSLGVDVSAYPIPLVDDSTVEALPYLWTDAVPFFAAFLALLGAQSGARQAEADKMYQRYELFMQRARSAATAGVLPYQYQQAGLLAPVAPGGVMPQQARSG